MLEHIHELCQILGRKLQRIRSSTARHAHFVFRCRYPTPTRTIRTLHSSQAGEMQAFLSSCSSTIGGRKNAMPHQCRTERDVRSWEFLHEWITFWKTKQTTNIPKKGILFIVPSGDCKNSFVCVPTTLSKQAAAVCLVEGTRPTLPTSVTILPTLSHTVHVRDLLPIWAMLPSAKRDRVPIPGFRAVWNFYDSTGQQGDLLQRLPG